jgi:UDP-GlcNAc:undecaprenyl-phosphate GlcNAc-1-phosphate transferase
VNLSLAGIAAIPALIGAFVAAVIVSLLLVPVAIRLAEPLGLVDRPGAARRVHTQPVARSGGLAGVSSFLVVSIGAVSLGGVLGVPAPILGSSLFTLLAGSVVALFVGVADDHWDLRARWQLLGQVGLAAGAVALGLRISVINNPLGPGVIDISEPIALVLTGLWIVGMINSVNFIDGLDGLSSGIGVIAALTLGLISLTTTIGQPFVGLLCFALAGALVGFLRWNFHPARVFLGTGGVMFLGYALAVLSIYGTAKVAVALLVLGVPIIDTFWIIVRRIASGSSPFKPDRGHIHHRLLDLGLTQRQAVVSIYALCAVLGILALVLSGTGQLYAFVGVVVGFGLVILALARRQISEGTLSPEAYPEEE